MSSITTLGGAIKALNNGQELLDTFRVSSKAFKKSEDAQSAFLETAEKLKTLLVDAGYNHELVSYNKPEDNATPVEQAFYAFVTDAAIQTMPARDQAVMSKDVDDCKGVWFVEVEKTTNGVTKTVKRPNPKTEKGRRKLAQQNVGQYRKRFVQALQRAWATAQERGAGDRNSSFIDVRVKGLTSHLDAIKNAEAEKLGKADAVLAQVLLERTIALLQGKLDKSVIAKYKAVK